MKQGLQVTGAALGLLVSHSALALTLPTPVDEPGSLLLLGGGVIAAVLLWRKNRRK